MVWHELRGSAEGVCMAKGSLVTARMSHNKEEVIFEVHFAPYGEDRAPLARATVIDWLALVREREIPV